MTTASSPPDPSPTAQLPPGWWRATRDPAAFTEAQRRLARPMTVLALLFTSALVLELSRDLSSGMRTVLAVTNLAIWLAFVAEYVWLLRLAPDRGRFVRTHVLDLLMVVLPVLRPLRAVRILRVVAAAARSWHEVFSVLRHRGLGRIISAVGALMLVGGLVAFLLEPSTFTSVGDAVWWVLVTSTTVGYGDFAPVGPAARLVAVVIMLVGIGLVGVITANIVDYLSTEGAARLTGEPAADGGDGGDGGEGGDGSDGSATPDGCAGCAATSARLATIEAQLSELLARTTPTADGPPAGGG